MRVDACRRGIAAGLALATIKLDSSQTGSRFSVVDATLPPGYAVPGHWHAEQDELFYLLDGQIDFHIGDERMKARAGTLILVPRRTRHEFVATSEQAARYLFLHAPGGFEGYVRETSEPAAPALALPPLGPMPTREQIAALTELGRRYGMEPAC